MGEGKKLFTYVVCIIKGSAAAPIEDSYEIDGGCTLLGYFNARMGKST